MKVFERSCHFSGCVRGVALLPMPLTRATSSNLAPWRLQGVCLPESFLKIGSNLTDKMVRDPFPSCPGV